jgi:hypothetical protein
MSTPSQEPPKPLTAVDVAQRLCTIDGRRFTLYPKVGGRRCTSRSFGRWPISYRKLLGSLNHQYCPARGDSGRPWHVRCPAGALDEA